MAVRVWVQESGVVAGAGAGAEVGDGDGACLDAGVRC